MSSRDVSTSLRSHPMAGAQDQQIMAGDRIIAVADAEFLGAKFRTAKGLIRMDFWFLKTWFKND